MRTCAALVSVFILIQSGSAQQSPGNAQLIAQRTAIEKELQQIAVVDRKVMVKMRDGKRMQADVYRPKNATGKILKTELRQGK